MSVRLRFLGVSGFEITTEAGTRLVVDPFLTSDPPSPVGIDELTSTPLHAVLVTHGAYDHLGQGVEIAQRTGATLLCGPEVRIHALAAGLPEAQLVKAIYGTTYETAGIRVRTLPACHLSMLPAADGAGWLSGMPVSFLIETDGGTRLFHSGDTSLFGDLRLFGELYRPHVALLCVGATEPGLAPLPPPEAALAAEWLGAEVVVPMHFRPGDPEPGEFATCMAERLPKVELLSMTAGDIATVGPFGN